MPSFGRHRASSHTLLCASATEQGCQLSFSRPCVRLPSQPLAKQHCTKGGSYVLHQPEMIPELKTGRHACKGSRNEYYGKREADCLLVIKDSRFDHNSYIKTLARRSIESSSHVETSSVRGGFNSDHAGSAGF